MQKPTDGAKLGHIPCMKRDGISLAGFIGAPECLDGDMK
jgi:hypothetical protein